MFGGLDLHAWAFKWPRFGSSRWKAPVGGSRLQVFRQELSRWPCACAAFGRSQASCPGRCWGRACACHLRGVAFRPHFSSSFCCYSCVQVFSRPPGFDWVSARSWCATCCNFAPPGQPWRSFVDTSGWYRPGVTLNWFVACFCWATRPHASYDSTCARERGSLGRAVGGLWRQSPWCLMQSWGSGCDTSARCPAVWYRQCFGLRG